MFEIQRSVAAPADVAWAVISDVVGYADVAPNLSKIEILDGEKAGMRRRCYDTRGRGWNETCMLWEEGRRYSMLVDTSDYPYPFSKMQGTWAVEQQPNGVLIKMRFDYVPKYGPIGWIIDRLLIKQAFRRLSPKLMDNWEAKIKERAGQ